MTTAVLPSEPAAPPDSALRMLTITANLLPMEIIESRRCRRVRWIVISALVVFAALLAAWYGQVSYQTAQARGDVRGAQDAVRSLLRQQHTYSDLASTRAESRAIRTQLAALLATDLRWSRLLSALQRAAPKGVQVTGVFGALDSQTTGGTGGNESSTGQLPGGSGKKLIGTLTVTGTGTGETVVAAYVDTLGKITGLENPLVNDATRRDGALEFTVRLNITEAALGGRYTSKTGTDTGGT